MKLLLVIILTSVVVVNMFVLALCIVAARSDRRIRAMRCGGRSSKVD